MELEKFENHAEKANDSKEDILGKFAILEEKVETMKEDFDVAVQR